MIKRGKTSFKKVFPRFFSFFAGWLTPLFAGFTLIFCRWAHAAPLHPRRCHRHFCTFSLHALYGVGLARLMWRNPSPRFRLLWRKRALYCATTAASGEVSPGTPSLLSCTSSLLRLQSANALHVACITLLFSSSAEDIFTSSPVHRFWRIHRSHPAAA